MNPDEVEAFVKDVTTVVNKQQIIIAALTEVLRSATNALTEVVVHCERVLIQVEDQK